MNAKTPIDALVTETDETDEAAQEDNRVLLHMPVDVRSAALALLAVLGSLYTLHWAERGLHPDAARTDVQLCADAGGRPAAALARSARAGGRAAADARSCGGDRPMGWHLRRRRERADRVAARGRAEAAPGRSQHQQGPRAKPATAIEKVQKAATRARAGGRDKRDQRGQRRRRERGVTKVQIEKPKFNVQDYLWTGTLGLVALVGQATVVLFLTFFLLASGDTFRRKMVKIAGPTFTEKRLTCRPSTRSPSRSSATCWSRCSPACWSASRPGSCFVWIGVEHAAVWGVVAGRAELHSVRRLDRRHRRRRRWSASCSSATSRRRC